ncbi:MAG: glycosyltransferase family 39 protein, partial [Anaerolineales bacterium]|nr:glycosyltransferase family 39 protein [Anaerolineales bacterium]
MIFRSTMEIVSASAADVHPPGYYILMKAWSVMMGGSEFALRSLSAFVGLVVISGIYLIGKQIDNYVVGSLAAVLGSIHPGLVYYS